MNKFKKHISNKISEEIKRNPIDNGHGINKDNITKHLIQPSLEDYQDPIDENVTNQYWTVLEEIPEEKTGYTIYYDQNKDEFGLGMHDKSDHMISLGIYGSFIETLNGM